MKSYNSYGCDPGRRCRCPVSFPQCSAWITLQAKAEAGDPEAIKDLEVAMSRINPVLEGNTNQEGGSSMSQQTDEEMAGGILDALVANDRKEGTVIPMSPPSPRQVEYLEALIELKVVPDFDVVFLKGQADEFVIELKDLKSADIKQMERPDVSACISMLVNAQRKDSGKGRKSWPNVPEGKYALLMARGGPQENDHDWYFYKVDKPTEGRWSGYTFVKRLIGAPGNWREIKVDKSRADEVMNRIAGDPKKAMLDFGFQTVSCGACGSPLSKKESRERGLGPDCAAKSQFAGWF
jgi:hypothetical protein